MDNGQSMQFKEGGFTAGVGNQPPELSPATEPTPDLTAGEGAIPSLNINQTPWNGAEHDQQALGHQAMNSTADFAEAIPQDANSDNKAMGKVIPFRPAGAGQSPVRPEINFNPDDVHADNKRIAKSTIKAISRQLNKFDQTGNIGEAYPVLRGMGELYMNNSFKNKRNLGAAAMFDNSDMRKAA